MRYTLLWITVAGACGTLARYGLAGVVQRWFGSGFPWATAAVNVIGCFLFGVVWALAADHGVIDAQLRAVILVGFMGAFTTFSTFGYESVTLAREGEMLASLANIVIQVVAGVLLVWLGYGLTKSL